MTLIKYCLSFLVLLFINACATVSDNSNNKEEVIAKNEKSLLWKIEGKGIKPSYIFGTMHLINAEYYNFSTQLKRAIEKSDAVIVEVSEAPDPLAMFELLKLDSGTIAQFYTAEELAEVIQYLNDNNVSTVVYEQVYSTMKPFLLLQAITQSFFDGAPKSYDLDIMEYAKKNKVVLVGLETYTQQIGFFDAISNQALADICLESIRNHEKEKKSTIELMELYANQKIDKLIPMLKKESPEIMDFEEIFLTQRNLNWIPKLVDQFNKDKCFVAVGAAHLFDDNGILALLKKEGYQLTPILMKTD